MLRSSLPVRIRSLSTTATRSFFGFSRKVDPKIIEKQDDFKTDPKSKITILDEKNSPNFQPFNAERDMPGFKVAQWKQNVVRKQDIEASYTPESVVQIMRDTYQELQGSSPDDLSTALLHDLQFRFRYFKALQSRLGFDISDYIISRSHSLEDLQVELNKVVAHRWSSERNPNAIVLRPEDFKGVPNVYLNEELSEAEQKKLYEEKLEEVRKQEGIL
ncbi:uncharacterized protein CXQ87_001592 [Candidozyma duobushaemuli]|uniref:Large ribosomal subunit protein mL50 n=2 Tax=Candidozyma TaxID=3303203 RepID=A0ABX8I4Q1_9ASCO|nr:uncharacterized protein CXQ87_001592 [[Candida] duobushaemulonis]PVH13487.1 hypothetical protein CXQ87_001592 [[Candida] duobushaemulonis]QWU88266.1 hypothetical protein CA3LBN_002531 [[Candida] haemuloni]